MRMDELKQGFWGYKKDSVYHYIVLLEEEASKLAAEKDARLNRFETESRRQMIELEREYKKRVTDLEAALAALREENRVLRDNQEAAFSAMPEARRYAGQIKADSVRQARQAGEELSAAARKEDERLGGRVRQLQRLRTALQDLLEEFDGQAEGVEKAMERLPVQAIGADRDGKVLFEGAPAAGAEGGTPDQEKGEAWNRSSYM